jgi:hypothetical protein
MEGVLAVNPGEEFNLQATPSQELLRKLAYLAAQDNDSVLTGSARGRSGTAARDSDTKAQRTDMLLQMARLADPSYQALSAQINANLDLMDTASVHALQEIEGELRALREQRERMLEQAYRDDAGNAIFMRADETGAYYQDGTQLADEDFAEIRPHLEDRPTWDEFQDTFHQEQAFEAERDEIHRHDAQREELREDLAAGRISKEEAREREQELEESLPERMASYDALKSGASGPGSTQEEAALSADELAVLGARTEHVAGSDANETPAAAPSVPPPSPG